MFLWYRAALVFSRNRRSSQEKNLTLEGRAQDQIVLAAGRRDPVERSKEYAVRLLYGRGGEDARRRPSGVSGREM